MGGPIGDALGPDRLQERDGAESRAPAWFSGRDRAGSRRKLFPRHSSTTNLAPDPQVAREQLSEHSRIDFEWFSAKVSRFETLIG